MTENANKEGRVLWITGLSGSGKSTIATAAAEQLRAHGERPVVLDGDAVRAAIADSKTGHDVTSRLANAYRISRLAQLLAEQGQTVIVPTMSLFREIHEWNRAHLPNYFETWVDVDWAELCERDARGLYSRAARGEVKNVAGFDLEYDQPAQPNLVLNNNPPLRSATELANELLRSALGLHPLSQRPHVVFYNLPNSGASALMPILEELLEAQGYADLASPDETHRFHALLESDDPVFHWTHHPMETFAAELQREDIRFISLTRDPRDTLVSCLKDVLQTVHTEDKSMRTLCREAIQAGFEQRFEQAHAWRALQQPNVFQIRFEEMKRDIPALITQLLEFIGLPPMNPAVMQRLCEKHSFESVTGRQRGEAGQTIRNKYLLRKGISGDWANQFDGSTARMFQRRFGRYLRAWGYEPNGEWAEAHAQKHKHSSNGTLFASLLQLEQMTDRLNSLTGYSRFSPEQQIQSLFQSKPRIDLN
jgi:adenylylsulfate kinase-like enzyme